jgi:hypothetical protein
MRLRFLLSICLVLAACSHKQPPAKPWTGAHWGMLPSEVLGAVPGAVQKDGSQLVTGATAKLSLDVAAVAGTALPAQFYFLDSRLVQVAFGDDQYRDNGASSAMFDRLAASLRKQYGPEQNTDRGLDPAVGLSRGVKWVAGDTEILLSAIPVTGTTSMLVLNYRRAAGV